MRRRRNDGEVTEKKTEADGEALRGDETRGDQRKRKREGGVEESESDRVCSAVCVGGRRWLKEENRGEGATWRARGRNGI